MDLGRDQELHQQSLAAAPAADRFKLFELAVEMADRVSARRATANTLFVTLHTALVAAIGLVRPRRLETGGAGAGHLVEDNFGLILIAVFGIVLAVTWFLLLKSYRDLNRAKFQVIDELEKDLPVPIFRREWELLKKDPIKPLRKRYAELGLVEQAVPVAFIVIYLIAIVRFS